MDFSAVHKLLIFLKKGYETHPRPSPYVDYSRSTAHSRIITQKKERETLWNIKKSEQIVLLLCGSPFIPRTDEQTLVQREKGFFVLNAPFTKPRSRYLTNECRLNVPATEFSFSIELSRWGMTMKEVFYAT